jgi:hypothetical protein
MSFFFLMNYFIVSGEQLEGRFKFCEHKNSFLEIVDVENSCFWAKQESKYVKENTKFSMYTLSKQKHRIYGKGFQCKEIITSNSYTVGFWGGRSEYSEETVTKLRRNDCLNMIKTKRCGDIPMTCDGENCFLDYKPTKKFAWLQTITLKGY